MATTKKTQYAEARTGKVNAGAPPHVRASLRRTVSAHRVNRGPGVRAAHGPTFQEVHDQRGANEAGGKANKARRPKGR
jgi:hypothetical protein